MNIVFSNQNFALHPSGALFWPEEKMLIVSDLHLEKGSHFARKGYFIPPYDTRKTLVRLLDVLADQHTKHLLILGDCFHDPKGYARLENQDRELFSRLNRYNPVWITGNHDGDFVPPGFEGHEEYARHNIIFRHEAVPGAPQEISGHYHPKVQLSHKGKKISVPCFVQTAEKMILPAFGSYTGGLFVHDPAYDSILGHNIEAHCLGETRVFSHKLSRVV